MTDAILTLLKDHILTNNPNTFQKGFSGARQYDDGKVVIYDTGEGEYVGLQDIKANYFYIRYLDTIGFTDPENVDFSCFEVGGNEPLRLVAWVKNANFGKLAEVLMQDIMSLDFDTLSATDKERFADLRFEFVAMEPDFEEIYKAETGKEEIDKGLGSLKKVTLIAIDFNLIFNYQIKSSTCVDRDVCSGCT